MVLYKGDQKTYEDPHCPALELDEVRRDDGIPRHGFRSVVLANIRDSMRCSLELEAELEV
jgi:hypothetical protein